MMTKAKLEGLLGGSWVVISRVIATLITHSRGLITPLINTIPLNLYPDPREDLKSRSRNLGPQLLEGTV